MVDTYAHKHTYVYGMGSMCVCMCVLACVCCCACLYMCFRCSFASVCVRLCVSLYYWTHHPALRPASERSRAEGAPKVLVCQIISLPWNFLDKDDSAVHRPRGLTIKTPVILSLSLWPEGRRVRRGPAAGAEEDFQCERTEGGSRGHHAGLKGILCNRTVMCV